MTSTKPTLEYVFARFNLEKRISVRGGSKLRSAAMS